MREWDQVSPLHSARVVRVLADNREKRIPNRLLDAMRDWYRERTGVMVGRGDRCLYRCALRHMGKRLESAEWHGGHVEGFFYPCEACEYCRWHPEVRNYPFWHAGC